MTETFNNKKYTIDHSSFGGLVYPSDFNTDYRGKDNTNGSTIATRIANDQKRDTKYRKHISYKLNNGGK